MKIKAHLVILAAGGFLSGYLISGVDSPADEASPTTGNIKAHDSSGSTPTRSNRKLTTHSKPPRNFYSLTHRDSNISDKSQEVADEIRSLETGQLQSLFDSLTAPGHGISCFPYYQPGNEIMAVAVKELYARNRSAMMEWLLSPADARTTQIRLYFAGLEAGNQSPAELKRWLDQVGDRQESNLVSIQQNALESAAGRSAGDFIQAFGFFGYTAYEEDADPKDFPDDFDFARLIRELPFGSGNRGALSAWAAADPEAAWRGVQEAVQIHGPKSLEHLNDLYRGVAAATSDEKASEWMVPKLATLPEEEREKYIHWFMGMSHDPDKTAAKLLAVHGSEGEQMKFAIGLMDPSSPPHYDPLYDWDSLKKRYTFGAFDALGSKDLKRDAILMAINRRGDYLRSNVEGYFEALTERADLDTEAKAMIRESMEQKMRQFRSGE